MDPFANDPYDSDSDNEASFGWPGVPGDSEHAKALMRGDFEVSPLVTAVPPMPEAGASSAKEQVPGIPSFSRGLPKIVLKKRKVEASSQGTMAHAFGAPGDSMPPAAGGPNPHEQMLHQQQHQQGPYPSYSGPETKVAAAASYPAAQQNPQTYGDMSRVFPPPAIGKSDLDQQVSPSAAVMHPPLPLPKHQQQQMQAAGAGLMALSSVAASTQSLVPTTTAAANFAPPRTETAAGAQFKAGQAGTIQVSAMARPGGNNGGIFDDAEDDIMAVDVHAASATTASRRSPEPDEESPTEKRLTSTPPRPISESMKTLSPEQRPNIRNIVLGAPPKASPGPKAPPEEDKEAPTMKLGPIEPRPIKQDLVEEDTAKQGDSAPEAKQKSAPVKVKEAGLPSDSVEKKKKAEPRKKKAVKSSKKVLLSKKEKEVALSLIRDKDDLLDCLPKEDCHFLAQEFWVFTVQQLSFVLGLVGKEGVRSVESLETARRIEKDMIEKLCKSSLLGGSNGSTSTQPPDDAKPEDAMDVDLPATDAVTDKLCKSILLGGSSGSTSTQPPDDAMPEDAKPDDAKPKDAMDVDPPATDAGSSNRSAAEDRLRSWKSNIEAFLAKAGPDNKRTPAEERFPLDGPLSCLIPVLTRNFFATVPITTLYGFLSLKRTETGAICDYLLLWRTRCSLSELSLLALAKHLLGVSSRIEAAISSIPPVGENTRKWMKDPMIVMTGAAREFLVEDLVVYTADEFVKTRTKDLATSLAAWRERKGLVPLKGSGKVAMVSGWKALAREAIEAEAGVGEVLKDVDLAALVALEVPVINDDVDDAGTVAASETPKPRKVAASKKRSEPSTNGQPSLSTLGRQAQYALETKLFLEDVLGADNTKVLSEAGISTAAELLDMNSEKLSALNKCILDAKRADNVDGCASLVKKWTKKLWHELELLSPKRKKSAKPVDSTAEGNAEAQPPAKKAKTKAKSKSTDTAERIVQAKSRSAKPRPYHSGRVLKDPYEILSIVTRKFLLSMDIDSAVKFLTTRTTDIAQAFVRWRIKEGMPELKGLGAIASVSGWKASIRKAAKEMGLEDIAIMEPSDKTSWGPYSRAGSSSGRKEKAGDVSEPAENHDAAAQKDVLKGKTRCLFAVVGNNDPPDHQYRFELSVRRPDENHSSALYVTYKGAAAGSTELRGKPPLVPQAALEFSGTDALSSQVSAMRDVVYLSKSKASGDVRLPFRSSYDGMGVIDISEYGVRPVKNQDLSVLKDQVKAFVLRGEERSPTLPSVTTRGNVIVGRQSQDKFVYLLKLQGPIERGQTVEVCFPEATQVLRSRFYRGADFQRRHLIGEAMHLLSHEDLDSMLSFLEDELLQAIRYEELLSTAVGSTVESNQEFKQACAARRRLHWVAIRVVFARGEDAKTSDKLCFGPLTLQKDEASESYPPTILQAFRDAVGCEVRNEMRCALELDGVCGSQLRKGWCPLAQQSLDKFVDCILNYYATSSAASADEMLEKLKTCLTEMMSEPIAADRIAHYATCMTYSLPDGSLDKLGSKSIRAAIERIRVDEAADSQPKPFIVCKVQNMVEAEQDKNSDGSVSSLILRPTTEVKDLSNEINEPWYRQLQWDIAMTVVAKAGSLLESEERPHFMNGRMLYELKQLAMEKTGLENLDDPRTDCLEPLHKPVAVVENPEPHSRAFFLCLVWPTLRKHQWRLEAGESPDSVTFIAPEGKASVGRASNPWKQKRDQRRWRLAREANRAGLGQISKLTKRLIVSILPHPETDEEVVGTDSDESKGVSAKIALRLYFNNLMSGLARLNGDDQYRRGLVKNIVDALIECFDEVAPVLTGIAEKQDPGSATDSSDPPSEETNPRIEVEDGTGEATASTAPPSEEVMPANKAEFGTGTATAPTDPPSEEAMPANKAEAGTNETEDGTGTAAVSMDRPSEEAKPMSDTEDGTGSAAVSTDRPSEETKPADDGCDYLLRLLLVLPSILRQSDLPWLEINDSLEIIQDLVDFLTSEHEGLFGKAFHPPREDTARQPRTSRPALISRIRALHSSAPAKKKSTDAIAGDFTGTMMTEMISEQEKPNLTDFVVTVLEQAIPCRATEKDVAKKYRRIHVGYPGFVCRHCMGNAGEGRYFFTTIESLTTASTVFEKHVLKCSSVPPSIKSAVVSAKTRHPEQRKHLPSGSQQAYFNRLWDRLRSAKIEGVANAGVYVMESYAKKSSDGNGESNDNGPDSVEFKDHVELLDFLRKTAPWKGNNVILEVLNQYYNCLDYGGRILYTSSAPEHFSAEWLLAKIAPRSREPKLKRIIPG